jgi:CubicO group peptidase (beta-lactamase class C family)
VPTLPTTTFDIWSATKTFTSLAFGRLIEDSHNRRPGLSRPIALESPAYDFVPATPPPTDPRKAGITIHQLRSMTSGIPGGDHSFTGIAAGQGASGGPFEIALGHATDRFGRSPARLYTDPGTAWDYADTAFAHLSMIFREAAGIEMSTYLDERLFKPLGITNDGWATGRRRPLHRPPHQRPHRLATHRPGPCPRRLLAPPPGPIGRRTDCGRGLDRAHDP